MLAGVAAARTELVAVVAGDMPDAAPALARLVDVLTGAGPQVEAAIAVDDEGTPNPLLAAYRTGAVLAAAPADPSGAAARSLLRLAHVEVAVPGAAARDVDTPDDLDALGDGR